MLNRLDQAIQKNSQKKDRISNSTTHTETQHGAQQAESYLLGVPGEILTGITSYLDPSSLQNLALVNRLFYDHVKNDNTWHRAFVQQFLGISFQSELHDRRKELLLRRETRTWKEEFKTRFRLRQKWVSSRNATIRHCPVHSVISSMHMMPTQSALLCASNFYGIVSRSLPLTGRILPGYINPTGPRIGIGIGNPNVEFAPNVSTCLLGSEGGTAKVLWGIRNGEVAATIAQKAIDTSRRGVNFVLTRCPIGDEHEGPVLDAAWDGNDFAVTGGADGRMKLWDTRIMKCLWTSERQQNALVPDPFIKVVTAVMTKGIMVGVMRSGNIVIYKGFRDIMRTENTVIPPESAGIIQSIFVECPIKSSITSDSDVVQPLVTSLHIDPGSANSSPSFLVAYDKDTRFYKLTLLECGSDAERVNIDAFGDDSFGPLSCIYPSFTVKSNESSFVLVGDHLGCVSVYDWQNSTQGQTTSPDAPIHPIQRFEAHDNGSTVTSLHWNGFTLFTGAANGTTHVFDALTFVHVRSFSSPTPRFRGRGHAPPVDPTDDGRVRQILVTPDKEVMIVNVGNAVMAWKAGSPGKPSRGVRGRVPLDSMPQGKKKNGGKWLQQAELKQNIAESRRILEQEAKKSRKSFGKTKEHHETLDNLGLSEEEALQYVLMLSREEQTRSVSGGPGTSTIIDSNFEGSTNQDLISDSEGMFEWENDDASGHLSRGERNIFPLSATPSHSSSYESDSTRSSTGSLGTSAIDSTHFPPFNTSPTPSSSIIESTWPIVRPISTPRISPTSAWNNPLASTGVISRTASSAGSSPTSGRNANRREALNVDDDLDEDLKFALELSLAEARSRGDLV